MAVKEGLLAAREVLDFIYTSSLLFKLSLIALLILGQVIHLIIHCHTSGLDGIPGPWLARYTNLHAWWNAQRTYGKDKCYLVGLHEKYGDVVRVAPRRLSIADPDAIPIIYGYKPTLNKSIHSRSFQPLRGVEHLASVRDAKVHGQMRKAVAVAYSGDAVAKYEARMTDTLRHLLERLDGESAGGVSDVNLGVWLRYYMSDVAGNVTYSEPLGYLEQGGDAKGLIESSKMFARYLSLTMPMPWLHDVISPFARLLVSSRSQFCLFSQRKVRERIATNEEAAAKGKHAAANVATASAHQLGKKKSQPDVLAHYLASRERYPDQMTEEQLVSHCMVTVFGGIKSATSAVKTVLEYLMVHPTAQERVYRELVAAGVADRFPEELPRNAQVEHLPYMSGLLHEALRLDDAKSYNPLSRDVGPDGMVLPGTGPGKGVCLPRGTTVGIKLSVLATQERVYGENPSKFIPERWMQGANESESQYQTRKQWMNSRDMSFSQGARGCIGKSIVMMQMNKALASIVCKYKILLPDRSHRQETYLDFYCILQPRESENKVREQNDASKGEDELRRRWAA
ncbi:cytochrome P450 [Xylariales sp. AK1849]|nr:cytochrome P450 [Xylariales sp. AK1849]